MLDSCTCNQELKSQAKSLPEHVELNDVETTHSDILEVFDANSAVTEWNAKGALKLYPDPVLGHSSKTQVTERPIKWIAWPIVVSDTTSRLHVIISTNPYSFEFLFSPVSKTNDKPLERFQKHWSQPTKVQTKFRYGSQAIYKGKPAPVRLRLNNCQGPRFITCL